jgi:hypothetical protein
LGYVFVYTSKNNRFRVLADEHRQRYRSSSRKEKAVIVQEVVDLWRSEDPPGRFLARTHPDRGDASLWHDVGNGKARKKVCAANREGSLFWSKWNIT